mmetsp:Transcript_51960/g.111285  ORF Transcript_51960/g.111285 Transcript_51960/m.111285 type:complete len:90 (+) Transcript_51960:314-583(+)
MWPPGHPQEGDQMSPRRQWAAALPVLSLPASAVSSEEANEVVTAKMSHNPPLPSTPVAASCLGAQDAETSQKPQIPDYWVFEQDGSSHP